MLFSMMRSRDRLAFTAAGLICFVVVRRRFRMLNRGDAVRRFINE